MHAGIFGVYERNLSKVQLVLYCNEMLTADNSIIIDLHVVVICLQLSEFLSFFFSFKF